MKIRRMRNKVNSARTKRAVKAATDKNITYHRSGGTYYFTTYEVYADGTWVGKLEDHNIDVKHEYFVAWVTKNGIHDPWKTDWETKSFYSEDEAIDWILSFQTAPIESGCGKKSVKAAYNDQSIPGERRFSEYAVFVNDDFTGYYYDSEEEAIAEAREYIESGDYGDDVANTYVERHDIVDYPDGDYEIEDIEIVWNGFDEYEND